MVELVAGVVVELGVVVLLLVVVVLVLLELVDDGVVVDLGVVVLLLVDRGVVVVGWVVELELVLWQSSAARPETVLTPCWRFRRSV